MATILCIDDSRHMVDLHQALLESRGYKVLIAPDGPTGIALSRQQSVDVVVLDFNMPGMDGNQVAQVMMQEQPTVPVVIWSGYPEGIPEPLRWFAYAVPYKGDGPEALLSVIESLVRAGGIGKKAPPSKDYQRKRTPERLAKILARPRQPFEQVSYPTVDCAPRLEKETFHVKNADVSCDPAALGGLAPGATRSAGRIQSIECQSHEFQPG